MEHFSTQAFAPDRRFRVWQDAVCRYFPSVDVTTRFKDDFTGAISTRTLGSMRITRVSSGSQNVRRSRCHIDARNDDLLQFNFQVSGDGLVRQDGRECVTTPGTFVFYDSTRPYDLRFSAPFEQIAIELSRTCFQARYGSLDHLTASVVDGTRGAGRFLYAFVKEIANTAEPDDRTLSLRLVEHFSDLFMTAIRGRFETGSVPATGRAATLLRVKTEILARLGDPDLSPEMIARLVGLPIRTLYALFEQQQTTVWRWVQISRLARCRTDLEDPCLSSRSITDIAYSRGFSDAAHFSRLFRKTYGLSPRECRMRSVGTRP